ncbi:MAG: hypothetical protein WCZ23_03590 [Rhodospirillaceae bacterium]
MKTLLLALMISALAAPAMAAPGNGNANGYQGQGNGLHLGHRQSAPLPLAAGVPALLLLGAAFTLARTLRRGGSPTDKE